MLHSPTRTSTTTSSKTLIRTTISTTPKIMSLNRNLNLPTLELPTPKTLRRQRTTRTSPGSTSTDQITMQELLEEAAMTFPPTPPLRTSKTEMNINELQALLQEVHDQSFHRTHLMVKAESRKNALQVLVLILVQGALLILLRRLED